MFNKKSATACAVAAFILTAITTTRAAMLLQYDVDSDGAIVMSDEGDFGFPLDHDWTHLHDSQSATDTKATAQFYNATPALAVGEDVAITSVPEPAGSLPLIAMAGLALLVRFCRRPA